MEELIKSAIIEIVDGPIKTTELVVRLFVEHPEFCIVSNDIPSLIENMVQNGELVEVEYVLPTKNYRTKGLLFPKGTQIL